MNDETVRSHDLQYTSHIVKVLKASQVQVDGTLRLDYGDSGSAPVRTESASSAQADAHVPPAEAGVPQEVRIIESNSDYAIIEVVCSCGSKCHVQCNYADIVNPGGTPQPDVVTNDPPMEEAAAEKPS
jgi:hypothetical protein